MKRILYILLAWTCAVYSFAQTATENYIATKTYTQGDNTTGITQIQYFDGLGRPVETVMKAFTPLGKDLVNTTVYDSVGREWQQWLPAASANTDGSFVNVESFKNTQIAAYNNDAKPYAQTNYEASPLNRVTSQFGAGELWHNNSKKVNTDDGTNTNTSETIYFYVNTNNQLIKQAYYAVNTLYKTTITDEDGKTSTEYKDKLGQVVLKRNAGNVDTYFVYNDLGQLSYVLPPNFVDGVGSITTFDDSNTLLRQFGYQYKYDIRGNCIYKRLPGCGSMLMVYDKADRLVLSQDSVQRAKTTKEWTVTKYDVMGRVIFTGVTSQFSGSTHSGLISTYKDDLVIESINNNGDYTTNKFANATPLIVNYYDNYDFRNNLPEPTKTKLNFLSLSPYDGQYTSAKGLLTGTIIYYLDGSGNSVTAMYYDYRGRVVQTRSSNHLGGFDITYNQYNFSGQVEKSLKEHNIAGQATISELYTNDYDHAGRLETTYYKLNTKDPVLLVNNTYDEFGRLILKKRHNDTDIEEFDYNIRNWSTRITSGTGSNKFEEKLYYNTKPNYMTEATPCFNGNISASTWTYNNNIKAYQYNYDNLNRYTGGYSYSNSQIQVDYQMSESFVYDKQGNIKNLNRFGNEDLIDQLTLTYNGNQLKNVYDEYGSRNQYNVKEYQDKAQNGYNTSIVEMAYDANGNLIKDLDREIVTIRYNLLNLPEIIQFKNGNQIRNLYDASGQKLNSRNYTVINYIQPIIAIGEVYNFNDMVQNNEEVYIDGDDYLGNIEYKYYDEYYYGEQNWNSIYLKQVNNPEGFFNNSLDFPIYNYFRRDHLGNNRELWRSYNNQTTQRTQYYPSGLPWASNTGDNPGAQNKKYNGKEFVEMHGLDEYDYGARGYYAAIGRWTSVDPLSEKNYSWSPYVYCDNNPIRYIDPDGRIKKDKNGDVIYTAGNIGKMFYNGNKIEMQKVTIYTDLSTPVKAYKNRSGISGYDSNCHGTTFAGFGQVWINPDQVDIILNDEYKQVNNSNAKIGDVIVFDDNIETSAHSVTVTKKDSKTGEVLVTGENGNESKITESNIKNAWQESGTTHTTYEKNSSYLKNETSKSIEIKKDNTNIDYGGYKVNAIGR